MMREAAMVRGVLAAAGLAVMASACASAPRLDQPTQVEEPASAPSPSAFDAGDVITLERGICFGACPVYTLSIRGDGAVSYRGERFVRVEGEQHAQIDAAGFATLAAKAQGLRFFELAREYRAQITDIPSYRVTLTIDGRTHSVTDYGGVAAGMPEGVRALESEIDRLAGSSRWTGREPPTGGP